MARVINRLGGEVATIYPAGGSTGQLLCRLMDREGVQSLAIPTLEEIREDFTVFEEATRQQYRFVLPGAQLVEQEWQECLNVLASIEPRPNFVVASGSLPPGTPQDVFSRVAHAAKRMDAKVAIDTSGVPLQAALQEGVDLIKPNLREFQELTGIAAVDDTALIEAGRRLIARNQVVLIALTLGPRGALLITAHEAFRADGLPIKPASVVGAGDSFLGSMVWSLANHNGLDTALRYGVAGGSAALLRPGTEFCRRDDVERFVQSAILRPISAQN